jgi:aspartyl protease family protein
VNTDAQQTILLVGFLVLAISALATRRVPFRSLLGSSIVWLMIGAVLFLGFNHRDRIDQFFASLTGNEEQRAEGGTVRIRMASDGHFWARVKLNGYERRMLIDSGATITAMSTETAKAAGIDMDSGKPPATIETANGEVQAAQANLQKLEIGPLKTEDLQIVVSPSFGEMDVLGMNFLSRLKSWRVQGNELILEPDGAGTAEPATEQPALPPATRGGERKRPEIKAEKIPAEQE